MRRKNLYNVTQGVYVSSPESIGGFSETSASGTYKQFAFDISMYYNYDYTNNRLACYFKYTGNATNGGFDYDFSANLKVNGTQIFSISGKENTNYSWTSPTYYFNCKDDGSIDSLNTIAVAGGYTYNYTFRLDPLFGIWYKINNIWKKVVPKLKINNIWKRCIVWKKINGVWKSNK